MGGAKVISGERGDGGTSVCGGVGPSLVVVVVVAKESVSGKRGEVTRCIFRARIGVRTVVVCEGVSV